MFVSAPDTILSTIGYEAGISLSINCLWLVWHERPTHRPRLCVALMLNRSNVKSNGILAIKPALLQNKL
uniref:Uncharacterized protein n=1 Tax=Rhizophora mucronata TaxID=61149 RepID=A0A2P2QZR7_RHIMU